MLIPDIINSKLIQRVVFPKIFLNLIPYGNESKQTLLVKVPNLLALEQNIWSPNHRQSFLLNQLLLKKNFETNI